MSKNGKMNKFETPNALGHVLGSRQRHDQKCRLLNYNSENKIEIR